jgi:outer membrane lipase/esterase
MTNFVARAFCFGAAGLILGACVASPAVAQTPFTSITVFGESYADRGNVSCFNKLGVANCPYPSQAPFPSNPPTDATQIVPFSYKLQQLYGIPNAAAFDYAISGATAYSGSNGRSETVQVDTFVASGRRLGPSDLVAVQFIGNDGLNSSLVRLGVAPPNAFDTGNSLTDARAEAARDIANFQKLVNAGLRNMAWLAPGDVALKPIGQSGPLGTPAAQQAFHDYYNAAFDALQTGLAPYARSGIRIFLFDLRVLEQRLNTTPQMYGYGKLGDAFRLPQGDGLHYNEGGFSLIARYMQNQIDAPTTVAPQGDVAIATANGFANSVLRRLDAYRAFSPFGIQTALVADRGLPTKAPPITPASSPWSVYGEVNYAGGRLDSQLFASNATYHSVGGTLGVEYRVDPNLRVGATFSYAQPNVDLATQNAHNRIDAFQFGGYASYTGANWFADGLLGYGRYNYALTRQGIIDTIQGQTNANAFVAAGQAGYLFDTFGFRVGPIAELSYASATVKGYTETGDVLVTMSVDQQKVESLTGGAGLQVRFPFLVSGSIYSPFINITGEHDFIGSGRTITTTQVTTPLLPVLTPIDSRARTYGKVAAGVAANITGNVTAMINGVTTFAREGGNDFGVNGGIKVAF